MSKHKLIGLHNHQIQFELYGSVYLIPRKDVEEKFNLYWFIADLYKAILKASLEKPWLDRYKV